MRKRYLINKPFQLKFILFLILIILVVSFNYLLLIYLFFRESHNVALKLNLYIAPHYAYFITKLKSVIIIESALFIIVTFLLILIIGIIYSHRIAGMLYRLNNYIDELSCGATPQKLVFRKKDYFKDMADNVNKLNDYLNMLRKKKN